uniref:Tudor domain-containing protein n=1 Tax=Globodera rostochiensis TaxID=31243 RepID=A0A914HXK7_GLORO
MTSCNRSNSPILKRLEGQGRRQRELVTDDEKIHRIVLAGSSAICKLAQIQSPNCIWFKLYNHITEQLQIHQPEPLTALELVKAPDERSKKRRNKSGEPPSSDDDDNDASSSSLPFSSEIQLYKYVMAPLEENVYARGRIIQLVDIVNARNERSYKFSYIHFIDEGYGAWMNVECLAKMDPILYWHPWQAFPIALFKLNTFQNIAKNKNNQSIWPAGLTDKLECVMAEYDTFRVEPVWESRRFCDRTYCDYGRANVYGMMSEDNEEGIVDNGKRNEESIAHRLALEFTHHQLESETNARSGIPSTLVVRTIFDAKQQALLCEPTEELTDDLLSGGIPRWRFVKPKFT